MCLRNCRPSSRSARGERAKTTSPLVSLSSRWTMRSRGSSRGWSFELLGDGPLRQVFERGVEFAPLFGPLQFGRVANGVHAGRLLDHDDMLVEVTNDQPLRVRSARQRLGMFEQNDDFVLLQPPGIVGADRVADLHAPRRDEFANLGPRRPAQPRPQHLRERVASFLRGDGEGGKHEMPSLGLFLFFLVPQNPPRTSRRRGRGCPCTRCSAGRFRSCPSSWRASRRIFRNPRKWRSLCRFVRRAVRGWRAIARSVVPQRAASSHPDLLHIQHAYLHLVVRREVGQSRDGVDV